MGIESKGVKMGEMRVLRERESHLVRSNIWMLCSPDEFSATKHALDEYMDIYGIGPGLLDAYRL